MSKNEKKIKIGTAIGNRRRMLGLSQEQLSNKAEVSYNWLTKLENNAIQDPGILHILQVAKALNCGLDDIMFWCIFGEAETTLTARELMDITEAELDLAYEQMNKAVREERVSTTGYFFTLEAMRRDRIESVYSS